MDILKSQELVFKARKSGRMMKDLVLFPSEGTLTDSHLSLADMNHPYLICTCCPQVFMITMKVMLYARMLVGTTVSTTSGTWT